MTTEPIATLVLVFVAGGFAAFAGWRGARPPNLARGPRLIPWRPVMMAAGVFALLALVHLANLLGIETGRSSR